MPAFTPWLAAHQPVKCEGRARRRAMLLQRHERVCRASGFETTGAAKRGTQKQAICLDKSHQGLPRQVKHQGKQTTHTSRGEGSPADQAACIKTSNSARTASFKAVDEALM